MVSIPVAAKTGKKAIEVVYNNIKLEVKGIQTKMPEGVEPFIFNGTTYLPVRAVAEALGEVVSYDKKTATVQVGSGSSNDSFSNFGQGSCIIAIKNDKGDTIEELFHSKDYMGKYGVTSSLKGRFEPFEIELNVIGADNLYISEYGGQIRPLERSFKPPVADKRATICGTKSHLIENLLYNKVACTKA